MILCLHSAIFPHRPPFFKRQETEEVSLALQFSHWMVYIHSNGITRHNMDYSSSWGFMLRCEEPPSFYQLPKWVPALYQKTGLNWACRAPCPISIIQQCPESSTALTWCSPGKRSHGLAPQLWSTNAAPGPRMCFPV